MVMEEPDEELAEPSIAQQFGCKGKKFSKRKAQRTAKNKTNTVESQADDSARIPNDGTDHRIKISLFDYSVSNFFKAMETIDKLCGEEEDPHLEQSEIQRLSSSVTFLREWRHFYYEPRSIRLACGDGSPEEKDVISDINLPQFSSAAIPKGGQFQDVKSESRDFVLNVGGLVWALDWCPQVHLRPDYSVKCEFLAVAAHPPGASYHKIGAPLTGRGVIQIWCLLNSSESNEDECLPSAKRKREQKKGGASDDKSTQIKRPRGRPRKNPTELAVVDMNCEIDYALSLETSNKFLAPDGVIENNEYLSPTEKSKRVPEKSGAADDKLTKIKKPRGRPRKNSKEITVSDPNCENQHMQALILQYPEDLAEFHSAAGVSGNCEEYALQQDYGTIQKCSVKAASECNKVPKTPVGRSSLRARCKGRKYNNHDTNPPLLTQGEYDSHHQPLLLTQGEDDSHHQPLPLTQGEDDSHHQPLSASCSIPGDVSLPRIVLCLAHNGKVAWDVKWRPSNVSDSVCKHRMGYLAVLLGNGSLEVWEVPHPRALRAIYQDGVGEPTDPRFIKLEPVFKCSLLKRGGLQSIPLTVEWSVSPPHDYLLAGCHDGTVALWKFSKNAASKCDDTKPLLCFGGDTVPIRAVAWAPLEGDPENSNIILTAGHEGLKFWDLRDPFRPLRKLHPVPRIIYSVDWLSNPSCIIMSFEDGTMRTLSLVKAANEFLVSGTKSCGKKQPGLHCSSCSSFAIWSVHVSRITGMVAYCSADGTVLRFQLTTKAVETDHTHGRVPHFFCGSVSAEKSTLTVSSPASNTAFPLKKFSNKGRHAASSFRGFLCESNVKKSRNNQMTRDSDSRVLGKPGKSAFNTKLSRCYNVNFQFVSVLRDGDNLGLESRLEEAIAGDSNQKKQVDTLALICRDNETAGTLEGDNEMPNLESVPETFPPKLAALHRVRWNMNKGSERWLCYGGAGGVVRCQEIVFSHVDKKWAEKR